MMNKKVFLIIACTAFLLKTHAQTDTVFWFAAPEITNIQTTYDGLPADRPIKLHFAAKNQSATVQIFQPALNSLMPAQTINVPANDMTSIDLTNWIDIIETRPGNSILQNGLKIISSAPITAYYTNEDIPNAESFMLKGNYALGLDFWIPSQNIGSNDQGLQHTYSSFDIIATTEYTVITINPSNDIVGHNANIPFTITLNKGETWSAEAVGYSANQHLGGSHVTSKSPIAITVKDDWVICPDIGIAYELIGDQILPTNHLGRSYIAVKGDLSGQSDRVFVMATEDNTIVSQNGIQVATINKGMTSQFSFNTGDIAFFETSKPSSIYHLSGVAAETGAKQLIPITEKGCDSVYYKRLMDDKFKLTFVVKNSGVSSFLVNGSNNVINAAQFLPVPNNSDYSYAKVDLSNSNYTQGTILKIVNTNVGFQMGVIDGAEGWGCDYAYFNEFSPNNNTIGIEEVGSIENLLLYPNPANKVLNVRGENVAKIVVLNVIGQQQYVDVIYGKYNNTVLTDNLSVGSYILEIVDKANNRKILKFTKAIE